MDEERKNRLIRSLKWGRLIIGMVGLVMIATTALQTKQEIQVIFPYYKIGTFVIGVFVILLGAENFIKNNESFINKFMILYGAIMIFITFII